MLINQIKRQYHCFVINLVLNDLKQFVIGYVSMQTFQQQQQQQMNDQCKIKSPFYIFTLVHYHSIQLLFFVLPIVMIEKAKSNKEATRQQLQQ
jgi:hypothetical protein